MRASRRQLLFVGMSLPTLIVAGCELPGAAAAPEFRVTQKSTFPDDLPHVDWSLVVERPNALRSIDTPRMARTRGSRSSTTRGRAGSTRHR